MHDHESHRDQTSDRQQSNDRGQEREPGQARGREHEAAHTSPRRSDLQDVPEQERPVTPAEEAGQSIPELEEPPQAEGPREDD